MLNWWIEQPPVSSKYQREGSVREKDSEKRNVVFAHSRWDIVLVILSVLELTLLSAGTLGFDGLSAPSLIGLAAGLIFLNCTNFQCAAHNFVHNPFFRSEGLNRIFGVLNTLALGVPQHLYRIQHLNHHRYNNDMKDRKTGDTKDLSSTYRYSRLCDRPESLVTYSFLGPFRSDYALHYESAKKQKLDGQILLETKVLLVFAAWLLIVNPEGVFFLYLPVWYLGKVLAYAENYLEHYRAIPGNRLTDSVSCYNLVFNLIWFNEGYHQEHHFRPQVHWTKVKSLRALMLPEDQRIVIRGAHWFNFALFNRGKISS